MTVLGFTGGSHCDADHADLLVGAGAVSTISHMPALPGFVERAVSGWDAEALWGRRWLRGKEAFGGARGQGVGVFSWLIGRATHVPHLLPQERGL